ncbi:MAG: hypothetical protein K1X74_10970 [Pirellulales bacterium]|nr:hypothetical protein [Pirellulales bacterium]
MLAPTLAAESAQRIFTKRVPHGEVRDLAGVMTTLEAAQAAKLPASVFNEIAAYAAQECLAAMDQASQVAQAEAWIVAIRVQFAGVSLDEIVDGHVARAVQPLLETGEFGRADQYLATHNGWLTATQRDRWADAVVDTQARNLVDAQQWTSAVAAYQRGLQQRPTSELLSQNAAVAIDTWARTAMDMQAWAAAIEIYDQGLKLCPSSSLLSQNREYCAQQLASH